MIADVRFQAVRGGDGEEIPVTDGSYGTLMESRDRSLRQAVFHSYYSSYRQFSNTLAAAYEGHVKQACFTGQGEKLQLQPGNVPGGQRGAGAGL